MATPAWTAQQIRDAEAPLLASLPSGALMQRAAAGLAEVIRALRLLPSVNSPSPDAHSGGDAIVVIVGPGNNGGDGLYAGASLARDGHRVLAWCPLGTRHPEAWAQAEADGVIEVEDPLPLLDSVGLVIDAVFGIDGRAGLPPRIAAVADACHQRGVPVVAVDLPSGLAADVPSAGEAHVRAQHTVTFGGRKIAHLCEPARSACGEVHVVDIGLDLPAPDMVQWTIDDVAAHLPLPDATSDKYSRGVVGLDIGSLEYLGAGILGAHGAVYSGAGMVRFAGPKPGPVRLALPNIVIGRGRVQAWVIGSGWGDEGASRAHLEQAVADAVPLVCDADALRPDVLAPSLPDGSLLTPHAGELARLLGVERADVVADPLTHARRAAASSGATVLLKGATQYVVAPDGTAAVAVPGPAWTAQAGSGDVLAGICGTMLAAGLDASSAALTAASLQAMAAADLDGPFPPQDVARQVASVMGRLARQASAAR